MTADLTLELVGPDAAADVHGIIRAAFEQREPVDPPAAALSESVDSVADAIARGLGLLARVGGEPAGAIVISLDGVDAGFHRVSVHPRFQQHGIATAMVDAAVELLADEGYRSLSLMAREEFPRVVAWWERRGFVRVGVVPNGYTMRCALPTVVEAPTAESMQTLGRRLATLLRAGDLLIASGDLGAGKTTLTQGIGAGLDVGGPVISPTFVLSRVHPSMGDGPALVHVDAYRLGSDAELDDLDLDESAAGAVTLVEWGAGIAEGLNDDRLLIDIRRSGDPDDESRRVYLTPVGSRWHGVDLAGLTEAGADGKDTP